VIGVSMRPSARRLGRKLDFSKQTKNPGIAAGVLRFVFVERDPGSAMHHFVLHRVRDDFVA
jgi:hypothetical protein